ncbi:MAG: hypothetical protein GY946_18285 [bacterium]|nr:hypothetical protein [bacterium]
MAAMAAGCTLRLELGGQLKYSLPVGAQAGFAGTVELRDGAGTVLRSHELSSSLSAPTKRAERNGMHTKTTTLPSGNHDALRLVIDGQLYAQCSQDGEWLLTAIRGSVPELDWTGCWPELGVIN